MKNISPSCSSLTIQGLKMIVFWDVAPCNLGLCPDALMMEAVSTSETSVSLYQPTRRNIPEDSHLHTRRRKNLISHIQGLVAKSV
jgi:hypothetical protein